MEKWIGGKKVKRLRRDAATALLVELVRRGWQKNTGRLVEVSQASVQITAKVTEFLVTRGCYVLEALPEAEEEEKRRDAKRRDAKIRRCEEETRFANLSCPWLCLI
jgi:predicted RNA-binding protein YlxR (DUF448 family)